MTQTRAVQPPVRRTLFLVTVALGILLNPLNSSMISVAMARLQHAFGLNFSEASWLISTYYLASAIAQPVMGRVSDMIGRRRVFLTGLALVAVSSITAPLAPTFEWLIVLRLIQSFGSGAIYPSGMGIVRRHISEGQAQALAFLSVFSSGAAAFGPSIGGLVMHWGDWKAIFLINLPIIVAGFTLALWVLPGDRGPAGPNGEEKGWAHVLRDIDLPGVGCFSCGIVALLLFLLSVPTGLKWWAGWLAMASFAAFAIRELRADSPFIDLRTFRDNPPFTWVLVQFMVVNIIFYSVFFGVPLYLQEVRGFTAQVTGLLMLCVAGFGVLMAPVTGRWIHRSGARLPLVAGGCCLTAGSALFLTLHTASPVWWLAVVLCVLGISNGFNNVGLQTALFAVTPARIIGAASGLFMTSRYMGTILSTVLLGMLFSQHLSTADMHRLGVILALIGAAVIAMSFRIPRRAGAGPSRPQAGAGPSRP
ncbi:MFS transporter [Alicyclobacillus sp.]|uniref:MFS transporter n=1 Tax=Alicyclobacillus sp. TaxID=61169 RepID=UPI0025BC8911|nr:MFS transporter [Alicyclobacillus sp.]MCL6517337.1 MFS transporter [Alicyclobacillus sp.]